MQEVKKRFNRRYLIVILFGFVLLMAFLPVLDLQFGLKPVSASAGIVAGGYVQCLSITTCNNLYVDFPAIKNTTLIIAYSDVIATVFNPTLSVVDSLGNTLVVLETDAITGATSTQSVLVIGNVTIGGNDAIMLSSTGLAYLALSVLEVNNVNESSGSYSSCSASGTGALNCVTPSTLTREGVNFAYFSSSQSTYCTPNPATTYSLMYSGTVPNNCADGQYNMNDTGSSNMAFGSVTNGQAPIAFVAVTMQALAGSGGSGCNVFACSTSTYSFSYSNETCIGAGCTATTTSTTISYDATTTVVTYITCSGSNCVTRVISQNKTITYTDTSVSVVKTTTTATVTNTALNAPTGNQLQFWLVPLIFLLGPAFGLMGGYGATVRERGGNPAATIAALMFMLGLNLGALGGIILKVMPFPVLVLTMIPLCLLLYSMR